MKFAYVPPHDEFIVITRVRFPKSSNVTPRQAAYRIKKAIRYKTGEHATIIACERVASTYKGR